MVGVPGRSKGCNTCRQRRIACGLQKPQCTQCVKSNRVCTGYQRERVFILNQGLAETGHKSYTKPPPAEIGNGESANGTNDDVSSSSRRKARTRSGQCTALQQSMGNTSLLHVAYRQQLLNAFLCCYVPIEELGPIREKSWLMQLPDLPETTKALEASTLALSMAKLGRVNDDPVLVKESLRLYTQGLNELQKALWDPELMYKDETLGACMALAMYELVECPSETKYGYASHHHGCARLVQLRGPEAHSSGLGHQIFLTFRLQGVLQALELHRPTYLASPTWTTTPFRTHSKSPFDLVMDFLAIAPEIWHQADELQTLEDPSTLLLATLKVIDRCWKLDAELHQFYEDLEASTLGPLYWPEFSREDNPADDPVLGKVFPVAFHFLNLRMANTLMFYWATLTMSWSGISRLYTVVNAILDGMGKVTSLANDPCPACSDDGSSDEIYQCNNESHSSDSSKFDMRHLPPLGHRADFLSPARNVCQSIEYCMQDKMLALGPSSIIAPLIIVVDTLKGYPGYDREVLWAKAVLGRVYGSGMRFLKYFDKL